MVKWIVVNDNYFDKNSKSLDQSLHSQLIIVADPSYKAINVKIMFFGIEVNKVNSLHLLTGVSRCHLFRIH